MNLEEIIARASQLASGVAIDAFQSAIVDAGFTFETLFPHAARFTVNKMIERGEAVEDLAEIVTINVADGIGTMPENVVRECLDNATIVGHPVVARLPYSDFMRSRFDQQMAYFAVLNDKFYFASGAEPFTDDVEISVPVVPTVPEDVNDPIQMSRKLGEAVILCLAAAMRGEVKISEMIMS